MKKYIFHLLFLLVFGIAGHAQLNPLANSTVTVAELKSGAQARVAYNSTTGGNVFTASIVARVSTPLGLTADQQKSMNTALYNFFNEKGAFTKLRFSDKAAYQQQVNTLVQKLIGQLGAFLSPSQVNAFVAMKPASSLTRDPLTTVFY